MTDGNILMVVNNSSVITFWLEFSIEDAGAYIVVLKTRLRLCSPFPSQLISIRADQAVLRYLSAQADAEVKFGSSESP